MTTPSPLHDAPLYDAVVVGGGCEWGNAESDESDGGYMGYYPVGADCARRLRQQGVPLYEGTPQPPA